jgi:hypothetical protein
MRSRKSFFTTLLRVNLPPSNPPDGLIRLLELLKRAQVREPFLWSSGAGGVFIRV